MEKEEMLKEIRSILAKGEFEFGEPIRKTTIFDIIAKKNKIILILKALLNMDSLRNEVAREMKLLGMELNASPLIIGRRSGMGDILDGVVYTRHGIPIISMETFREFVVEGHPPMVLAAPGGFYVRIDGSILREMRHRGEVSLGQLAAVAGVSRKTIQLYEEGMSSTLDSALKLEKCLKRDLILPLNLLETGKGVEENYVFTNIEHGEIFKRFVNMGFDIFLTLKCPFDALSKDESDVMLMGVEKSDRNLKYKAMNIKILSNFFEKRGFVVVEESEYEEYKGVPIIRKVEVMKKDKEEIKELVEERSAI